MRDILFNKDCETLLNEIANEYGVITEDLWQAYMNKLRSNFEQDLRNIANKLDGDLK